MIIVFLNIYEQFSNMFILHRIHLRTNESGNQTTDFNLKKSRKKWRNKMQRIEMPDTSFEDVASLKKRVQHLEEEMSKLKLKMTGKRWL
jgi:ATP-dependent Zn protease